MTIFTTVPDSNLEPGDPIRSVDIIGIKDNTNYLYEKIDVANVQTFNSSGTWTKPTINGTVVGRLVRIQVWAGGGGSGRAITNSGGGGGGGYNEITLPITSLGSSETVTIGAGGTGRTGSSGPGTVGGDSSFGTHCTAYGGGGGGPTINDLFGAGGGGGGQFSAGSVGLNESAVSSLGSPATLGGLGESGFGSSACETYTPAAASGGIGFQRATLGGGGGGGGGSGTSGTFGVYGGFSVYGGGGGGGGSAGNTDALRGLGGRSVYGGQGGNGGRSGAPVGLPGTAPGGGAGGSFSSSNGANGAAGRVVVTVF